MTIRTGDYVKCVMGANRGENVLREGQVYQVSEVDSFGFLCVDGHDYPWLIGRFEFASGSEARIKMCGVASHRSMSEMEKKFPVFIRSKEPVAY